MPNWIYRPGWWPRQSRTAMVAMETSAPQTITGVEASHTWNVTVGAIVAGAVTIASATAPEQVGQEKSGGEEAVGPGASHGDGIVHLRASVA